MGRYTKAKEAIKCFFGCCGESEPGKFDNAKKKVRDFYGCNDGVGGGEIPTCTVQFINGGSTEYTVCHYMKSVDGVLSLEQLDNGVVAQDDYNVTLENVACGSLIYFGYRSTSFISSTFNITVDGSTTVTQLSDIDGMVAESLLFSAPKEAGANVIITISAV